MGGNDDKTEQATPQKRKESREKGQVARSNDATSAGVLLCGLFALKSSASGSIDTLRDATTYFLGNASKFPLTVNGVHELFQSSGLVFLKVVGPVFGGLAVAAVSINVAQVGINFSPLSFKPDLNRMNPLTGLQRMVSPKGLVELAKSFAKVSVVGWVVYSFLRGEQTTVLSMGAVDHATAGHMAGDLLWRLCVRACSTLLIIGAADYIYQKMEFEKSQKMTKHEVKQENKQSEGDPLIKSQFRQRHRQLAMKRMMQDVPTADVVVTNPTHYAVALKYDATKMVAPVIVAKGKDLVAQRIKEIAKENKVPTVENVTVARALFAAAEVGHPVPVELYSAVAEILAFVYRLKRPAYARA